MSICETSTQPNKSQTLAYLALVEGDDAVDLSVRSQPSPANPRLLPTSVLLRASILLVCETSIQSNKSQTPAYLGLVEGDDTVGLWDPNPIQPHPTHLGLVLLFCL